MSYLESIEYLYGLQKHGIKLGLETTQTILDRIGHPHTRYPALHVGGTNGKGSTAALVASVLQEAGYRVGLYTSPHLVDFRERIRVNGALIEDECVTALTDRLREALGNDLAPTFFEFTTALVFQHFADSAVEVAVVEVGLGGRFDATNVLTPVVSAITTVALDHEEYLGHTVASVAYEKAGIIKPGVPVVVGRLPREAITVVEQAAAARAAPLYRLHREFRTTGESTDAFDYHGVHASYRELSCSLAGAHQQDNAACALAMLEVASERSLPVSEAAIRTGLREVRWEGRLETLEYDPQLVLDGAHNPAAAEAVAAHLVVIRRARPGMRVVLVLGMMRDKDREGFLDQILPFVDEVIVTQARVPRAATVEELGSTLKARGRSAHLIPDPADAIELARRLADPRDLILVTGSLMLVGEIKARQRGCDLSPLRG